jgi:hypothetical protein
MENSLTLTGVLIGKDVKAPCGMKVHVKTAPYFVDSPFTDLEIEGAPCDIPEGPYEVRFPNQAASLRHEYGQWAEGIPWEAAT